MGNRRQRRLKTILPVRIAGTDRSGNRFLAIAHTVDISDDGARLGGVVAPIEAGSTVELQFQHRKAKFKVQWIDTKGEKQQAGVALLERNKDVWGATLAKGEFVDDYQPPRKQTQVVSTRKTPRYQANASVDLIILPEHRTLSGQLQNISLGGCYVRILDPVDVHTQAELLIQVDGTRINAFGTVRSSHAGRGMGIKFTGFRSAEDEMALTATIAVMAGNGGDKKQKQPASANALSEKVRKATKELYELEEVIKQSKLDPGIFREFREAVGQVRSTSWAMQRYFDQGNDARPGDVLQFLNTERIRLAVRMCNHLASDLKKQEINRQSPHLAELLEAVEDLFTRLAGFEFKVVDVKKVGGSG